MSRVTPAWWSAGSSWEFSRLPWVFYTVSFLSLLSLPLVADPHKFYPGATYMLSIFYTRKGRLNTPVPWGYDKLFPAFLSLQINLSEIEVAARIAVLYCAQILATGFSGLIAAGVFAGLDDVRGIAGWRWCVTHQEINSSIPAPFLVH